MALPFKPEELAGLAKHIIFTKNDEYKAFAACYKTAKKAGACKPEYEALVGAVKELKAEVHAKAGKEFHHLEARPLPPAPGAPGAPGRRARTRQLLLLFSSALPRARAHPPQPAAAQPAQPASWGSSPALPPARCHTGRGGRAGGEQRGPRAAEAAALGGSRAKPNTPRPPVHRRRPGHLEWLPLAGAAGTRSRGWGAATSGRRRRLTAPAPAPPSSTPLTPAPAGVPAPQPVPARALPRGDAPPGEGLPHRLKRGA